LGRPVGTYGETRAPSDLRGRPLPRFWGSRGGGVVVGSMGRSELARCCCWTFFSSLLGGPKKNGRVDVLFQWPFKGGVPQRMTVEPRVEAGIDSFLCG